MLIILVKLIKIYITTYWCNFIDEKNIELNEKEFIIWTIVNTNDGMKPGYTYEADNNAMIYLTPSEMVNENYKFFFDKTTHCW